VLEPCDAKVSRTVLRGLGASNGAWPLDLLMVLYHLADFAVAVNFAWILDPSGTVSKYLPHAFLGQMRSLVYPVVWYSYLLNSRRVRNTFFSETRLPLTLT